MMMCNKDAKTIHLPPTLGLVCFWLISLFSKRKLLSLLVSQNKVVKHENQFIMFSSLDIL
jgi:hypothetical protein